MDDSDEDLYGPSEHVTAQAGQERAAAPPANAETNEQEVEEEYEEVEESDEDEWNIITEASPETIANVQARHSALRGEPYRQSADPTPAPKRTPTHYPVVPVPRPDTHISTPATLRPSGPQKPGSAYPPVHASNIDVNANPVYPPANKPILSVDPDADLPGDDKPWRKPGTDLSDYFNYGFDEFTWASYCLKQQETMKGVEDQKKMIEDMTSFLSMVPGGMPGMPGPPQGMPQPPQGGGPSGPNGPGPGGMMPTPPGMGPPQMMPGMPGMPDVPPEMMQAMMAGMMPQGMDQQTMESMMGMQFPHSMTPGGPPGSQMQGPPQGAYGAQPGQRMPGPQSQMGYNAFDQRGGFGSGMRGKGTRRW
ncbi:cleavage polyadenylation factor subunit fip1 [Ascosphaera pollenicola]|nr:cleavage polyadenylation factor subunit fip1 [Ascosphaera pollenicola]